MITGREANILRCMVPQEEKSTYVASDEREEQRKFNEYLETEQKAGRLRYVNPLGHKPSTIAEGHPDYTIFLSRGRVLLIEMKVPGGTLSLKQRAVGAEFLALQHPVHTAWNHLEAINLVQIYARLLTPAQPQAQPKHELDTGTSEKTIREEGAAGMAPE